MYVSDFGDGKSTKSIHVPALPAWTNSTAICALADNERHLGHILKIGERWYAFDATHFNEESNGFRKLGSFASATSAKVAVEVESCHSAVQFAGAA